MAELIVSMLNFVNSLQYDTVYVSQVGNSAAALCFASSSTLSILLLGEAIMH